MSYSRGAFLVRTPLGALCGEEPNSDVIIEYFGVLLRRISLTRKGNSQGSPKGKLPYAKGDLREQIGVKLCTKCRI